VSTLTWDQTGHRIYETGVDRGVLYIPDDTGVYTEGYAWNGLTTVTESPSGAESNPQFADNIKYLNLISAEQFGGTVEAFTYPDEFAQCDGTATPTPGVAIGQQSRKTFGLSYRTKVGNDIDGQDFGYKLHLVYGATAAPSEKAFASVNDSPAATAFSWAITTIPVDVPGFKPTATLTIDSTKVDVDALADLEDFLYGTTGTDASLPTPADVLALFTDTVTVVTPSAPTYNNSTHTITIPVVAGVIYKINGLEATGAVVITMDTVVNASPTTGHKFPDVIGDEWYFDFS
jgi:hypothetical protein